MNAAETEEVRAAELTAAMSLATDIGLGGPEEHAQRAAVLAAGLAGPAGFSAAQARDAFYLALLKTLGCTGDEDVAAAALGEGAGTWAGHMGGAAPSEALALMWKNIGRGKALPARLAELASAFAKMPAMMASSRIHCELGQGLARNLGLPDSVVRGLGQVFEKWDGGGRPHHLRGEQIDPAVGLAQIATDAEIGHRLFGLEGAVDLIRKRAGRGYDPKLVRIFCDEAPALFPTLEVPSITAAVLAAEPGRPLMLSGPRLESAIRAMGEYADLKSRFTRGHSAGVSALATATAAHLGMSAADQTVEARAGHLHDLGRSGILLRVWEKAGHLSQAEWERVRMHTYYTERILSRVRSLGPVASLASLAHERLDGEGYHRRLPLSAVPLGARVLAAADSYHAMTEERPHRPPLTATQAAAELAKDAVAGRLDREAVDAVLFVAGHKVPRAVAARPAGLSEREVEVLRLVARGLTNKEIASKLQISVKTAGHHLEHIFEKVRVTTRAAAALYAMQNDLLASI